MPIRHVHIFPRWPCHSRTHPDHSFGLLTAFPVLCSFLFLFSSSFLQFGYIGTYEHNPFPRQRLYPQSRGCHLCISSHWERSFALHCFRSWTSLNLPPTFLTSTSTAKNWFGRLFHNDFAVGVVGAWLCCFANVSLHFKNWGMIYKVNRQNHRTQLEVVPWHRSTCQPAVSSSIPYFRHTGAFPNHLFVSTSHVFFTDVSVLPLLPVS